MLWVKLLPPRSQQLPTQTPARTPTTRRTRTTLADLRPRLGFEDAVADRRRPSGPGVSQNLSVQILLASPGTWVKLLPTRSQQLLTLYLPNHAVNHRKEIPQYIANVCVVPDT